jgi:hypothetical protein
MNKDEAVGIIDAIKSGKKYFKPLPYQCVEGGTTIFYDQDKKTFVENYLNRSVYDRGEENYTILRTEQELLDMFIKESYTDRKYLLPTESNEYKLEDPDKS